MLPKYAALFEQPMRVRGGENVRATGYNGSYTISAEAAAEVEEEAAASVEAWTGAWYPSHAGAGLIDLTAGSVEDGTTTFNPDVTDITVHETSLNYVYLECNITPTVLNSYVTAGVITAAIVKAYTTTKTNTNSKAYLLLCTWQAGALVDRYRYFSQGLKVQDTQDNTTRAASYFYPVA